MGTPLLVPVPRKVILREGYTGKNKKSKMINEE